MSLNEIIIYLMVIFMILGAIDRIIGNKFGLGQEFESGIMALGSLALAMVGIISLAPVLAPWSSCPSADAAPARSVSPVRLTMVWSSTRTSALAAATAESPATKRTSFPRE